MVITDPVSRKECGVLCLKVRYFVVLLIILSIYIIAFPCFPASKPSVQGITQNGFTIFSSGQKDRFVLKIPNKWNKKIDSVENGIQYMFWDNQGNAFSIVIKSPNTFKQLIEGIEKNAVSKSQLLKIQKEFAEAAPAKIGLSLSVNTISNRKSLTQTYYYKQETLGHVLYLVNMTHDFLYNDNQYTISYSMGGSTVDSAIQNFEASERRYFTPMLVSFFLN